MKFRIFTLSAAILAACLFVASCSERSNPFDPKSPNYVGDTGRIVYVDTGRIVYKSDTTPTLKIVHIQEGASLGPGGNANLEVTVMCELQGCSQYKTESRDGHNTEYLSADDVSGDPKSSRHYFLRSPTQQNYSVEFFCKCEAPNPSVSSDTIKISYSRSP